MPREIRSQNESENGQDGRRHEGRTSASCCAMAWRLTSRCKSRRSPRFPRATPNSLQFIANRLLESADGDDHELGRTIRDEVGLRALGPDRIDHMLFAMSGNGPNAKLEGDLENSADDRNQHVVSLRIEDHQDFIAEVYEEAMKIGDE